MKTRSEAMGMRLRGNLFSSIASAPLKIYIFVEMMIIIMLDILKVK